MMFSFLWSGNINQHTIHPYIWDLIAKPNSTGCWGLCNLNIFNKALVTRLLWHVITQEVIWHHMIFGKYIFPLSIARWLRLPDICTQNASLTCLSITKNIKYIHQWICWKSGSGFEIYIGRDTIPGLGLVTYLSRNLLEQLNLSNMFFLFQGQSPTDDRLTCTIWK